MKCQACGKNYPYAIPPLRCSCGHVDAEQPASPEAMERQRRIKEGVEKLNRLIGWIQFFAIAGERGTGDTFDRLRQRVGTRSIAAEFDELAGRYSCCGKEAAQNLNERWPY